MSTITQCPECGTRFKISQQQLEAYHGMVRCGRCQAVFDAIKNLYDDEPSPQLDLPIMLDAVPEEVSADTAETSAEEAETSAPADEATLEPAMTVDDSEEEPEEPQEEDSVESGEKEAADEFLVVPKKKRWPWAVAVSVLLLFLLGQAAYFYRVELAARLPGLKPALVSYCSLLGCQVTLPQVADLMSIDASDMEADPDHANVITLTATLRNNATYAQAYPDLGLTLNDTNNNPVARRTFHPAEYLGKGKDEKTGLGGKRVLDVKLSLDTGNLKPAGYQLLLFYPHKGASD